MLVVSVIHFFPFALLLVSGALETIDTQLEEGAELLGASRFTILRKITFPIVAPAFLAAFVLTFGRTIGTFALPYLLGTPARYHTLSTMLYTSLKLGFDPIAYILGIVLIFFTTLVVYGSNKFLGGNGKINSKEQDSDSFRDCGIHSFSCHAMEKHAFYQIRSHSFAR